VQAAPSGNGLWRRSSDGDGWRIGVLSQPDAAQARPCGHSRCVGDRCMLLRPDVALALPGATDALGATSRHAATPSLTHPKPAHWAGGRALSAEDLNHPALKFGMPQTEQLRFFSGFVSCFDGATRNPKWVLEHVSKEGLKGEGTRYVTCALICFAWGVAWGLHGVALHTHVCCAWASPCHANASFRRACQGQKKQQPPL